MQNLPPHELYATQLSRLNFGYALFEPNPNGAYEFVRVGDVGYISEDGKFVKLFNAFGAPGSLENVGSRFPDGFEPIAEVYRERDQLEHLMPGLRRSQSVRTIGGDLSVSGPTQVIAGGTLRLSCSSGAGAALLTKYRGTRHKALASKAMENYMMTNCSSWLQLAQGLGRPVEMHDLIFVRECILSGDWANISWNSNACDIEASFSVGLPSAANIGLSFWGQWQQHVEVPKRQGPFREILPSDGQAPVFDQCIFLKGIRISERGWYSKMAYLLKSSSSKKKKGWPSGSSALKRLTAKDFEIKPVGSSKSSFRSFQNAYDALAVYIFESSDADFAIIDDVDLFSLSMYKASNLDDICEILLDLGSAGPTIEISLKSSGAKVGRISWITKEPGPRGPDDLVLLDENLNALHIADRGSPQSSQSSDSVVSITLNAIGNHESQQTSSSKAKEDLDLNPPPPYTHQKLAVSYKTRLLNYKAKYKVSSLNLTRICEGKGHQPSWTTICTIDEKEYGCSTKARKKSADEEAARQALFKLYDENSSLDLFPSSMSSFTSYTAECGFESRVRMTYEESGARHKVTWTCRILRDDKLLASGSGTTKKKAAEEAARIAETVWHNS